MIFLGQFMDSSSHLPDPSKQYKNYVMRYDICWCGTGTRREIGYPFYSFKRKIRAQFTANTAKVY